MVSRLTTALFGFGSLDSLLDDFPIFVDRCINLYTDLKTVDLRADDPKLKYYPNKLIDWRRLGPVTEELAVKLPARLLDYIDNEMTDNPLYQSDRIRFYRLSNSAKITHRVVEHVTMWLIVTLDQAGFHLASQQLIRDVKDMPFITDYYIRDLDDGSKYDSQTKDAFLPIDDLTEATAYFIVKEWKHTTNSLNGFKLCQSEADCQYYQISAHSCFNDAYLPQFKIKLGQLGKADSRDRFTAWCLLRDYKPDSSKKHCVNWLLHACKFYPGELQIVAKYNPDFARLRFELTNDELLQLYRSDYIWQDFITEIGWLSTA